MSSNNDFTIAVVYPNVGRIVLFAAFEEADPDLETNFQQIIFTPEDQAALRLDCPREGCVGGGFDFAPMVDALVEKDESRVHGKLECHGKVGADGACCSLKAEYHIVID